MRGGAGCFCLGTQNDRKIIDLFLPGISELFATFFKHTTQLVATALISTPTSLCFLLILIVILDEKVVFMWNLLGGEILGEAPFAEADDYSDSSKSLPPSVFPSNSGGVLLRPLHTPLPQPDPPPELHQRAQRHQPDPDSNEKGLSSLPLPIC